MVVDIENMSAEERLNLSLDEIKEAVLYHYKQINPEYRKLRDDDPVILLLIAHAEALYRKLQGIKRDKEMLEELIKGDAYA